LGTVLPPPEKGRPLLVLLGMDQKALESKTATGEAVTACGGKLRRGPGKQKGVRHWSRWDHWSERRKKWLTRGCVGNRCVTCLGKRLLLQAWFLLQNLWVDGGVRRSLKRAERKLWEMLWGKEGFLQTLSLKNPAEKGLLKRGAATVGSLSQTRPRTPWQGNALRPEPQQQREGIRGPVSVVG